MVAKQRRRADEAAADNFAKQLVTNAALSVFPRSTPMSALGSSSPDMDATQFHPREDTRNQNIGFSMKIQLS